MWHRSDAGIFQCPGHSQYMAEGNAACGDCGACGACGDRGTPSLAELYRFNCFNHSKISKIFKNKYYSKINTKKNKIHIIGLFKSIALFYLFRHFYNYILDIYFIIFIYLF